MSKKNPMGSDVIEGFSCKPKILDKNKPVMFSAAQIFICDGERCKNMTSENLSDKVRNIIKTMGYDRGENRVKVTRTYCNGTCRFKKFVYTYSNGNFPSFNPETSYTAWKQVHKWTDEQWKELIISLVEGKNPVNLSEYKVENKIYDE